MLINTFIFTRNRTCILRIDEFIDINNSRRNGGFIIRISGFFLSNNFSFIRNSLKLTITCRTKSKSKFFFKIAIIRIKCVLFLNKGFFYKEAYLVQNFVKMYVVLL